MHRTFSVPAGPVPPSAVCTREGATDERNIIETELAQAGFGAVDEIGRGGCGIVYRCYEYPLSRHVAVKVSRCRSRTDELQQFACEQRALGVLSGHPHIVPVLQANVTCSGRPYLVMPYDQQGSLERLLHTDGPLHWQDVLSIGVKTAGALAAAHASGIVHRDVKPGNILLTDCGEPQLSDFGIASFATQLPAAPADPYMSVPNTRSGRSYGGTTTADTTTADTTTAAVAPTDATVTQAYAPGDITAPDRTARDSADAAVPLVRGTPAFTAPEVLHGAATNPAADVYGLGATLYCLLTGVSPYARRPSEPLAKQLSRICTQKPPNLRGHDIPEVACAAIEAAMSRNPADRPTSMAAFGHCLQAAQCATGQPVDTMVGPRPRA